MATEVPTAFLSYSRTDSEFALRLSEDLKAAGAAIWLDQTDIDPGEEWDLAVERALLDCPRMLVILSPVSVVSPNVRDEISFALKKRKTIIPVLYQDCEIPFRLDRIQHVDFRIDYARGLKGLLKILCREQSFPIPVVAPEAIPLSFAATEGRRDTPEQSQRETEQEQAKQETRTQEPLPKYREAVEQNASPLQEVRTEVSEEPTGNGRTSPRSTPRPMDEPIFPSVNPAITSESPVTLPLDTSFDRLRSNSPHFPHLSASSTFTIAGCILLLAALLTYWVWPVSQPWEQQPSGTTENLNSVSFVTPESGWAVGSSGTILHTEDGGRTWNKQISGTSEWLASVTFATPQSGWVVGSKGVILHTEDSGNTWKTQTSGVELYWLGAVIFVTPQSGWATGYGKNDSGVILHTIDGGTTWKIQPTGDTQVLSSVAFPTLQSGWVVGNNGILHTEDGGNTWTKQMSFSGELNFVTFVTPQIGWAGEDYGPILHTNDGGQTWEKQASENNAGLKSAAFLSTQVGWAVGKNGFILHTVNGGKTWKQQRRTVYTPLNSVAFPSPESGWAVGDNGVILHTK